MELGPCDEHGFEAAEDTCRNCGRPFCGECLVYSFGKNKPPYCTKCAVSAAGIRKSSQRTKIGSKRAIKKQNRAIKKARKKAEKSDAGSAVPLGETINWETLDADDSGPVVRQVDDTNPGAGAGGLNVVAAPDDPPR